MAGHVAAPVIVEDLSDALLGHILSLAGREQGPAVTLVCKRWHQVFYTEPALWRCFHVQATFGSAAYRDPDKARLGKLHRLLCSVSQHVASLQAAARSGGGADGWQMEDFVKALRPSVATEVALRGLKGGPRRAPAAAATAPLPSASATAVAAVMALLHLPRLTTVELEGFLPVETAHVTTSLRQLRSLSLSNSAPQLPPGLFGSILALQGQLTQLELKCNEIPDGLSQLTQLDQLRRLTLDVNRRWLARGMWGRHHAHEQSRQRLEVEVPLALLPTRGGFPHLQFFQLQNAIGYRIPGGVARSLQYQANSSAAGGASVQLKGCRKIDSLQEAVSCLLPQGTPLQELELIHTVVPDGGAASCRLLRTLRALRLDAYRVGPPAGQRIDAYPSDAKKNTDLLGLLKQAPQLEELELGSSYSSVPEAAASMAGLRSLKLGGKELCLH